MVAVLNLVSQVGRWSKMGIDVYMRWDGFGKEDRRNPNYKNQMTGFAPTGKHGYLRGAYFGGQSDVIRFLFDWFEWNTQPDDGAPFDCGVFEYNLKVLKRKKGERPGKGMWDHTKGREGWDLSGRQNHPIDKTDMKEYTDFLKLGKRLQSEGKNPRVKVSY